MAAPPPTEQIHEFVRGHFYGHYNFSLDRTIYLFSAGRFEPFNKGYDMYIESLARLNHRMKEARRRQPSDQWQTVVAFLITKKPTRSYNVEYVPLFIRSVLPSVGCVCVWGGC